MTTRRKSPTALRVAENLRRLRDAAGLTQEELAKRCKRTREWVAQVEGARYPSTRTQTLQALAKALDVDLSEFFRGAA